MAAEDTDRTSEKVADKEDDVVDEMLLFGPCREPALGNEGVSSKTLGKHFDSNDKDRIRNLI